MTPVQALQAIVAENPRGVLVLSENTDGSLGMVTGPDMTLEHINLLLDQAKYYIVSQTMASGGPVRIPTAGVQTLDTPETQHTRPPPVPVHG